MDEENEEVLYRMHFREHAFPLSVISPVQMNNLPHAHVNVAHAGGGVLRPPPPGASPFDRPGVNDTTDSQQNNTTPLHNTNLFIPNGTEYTNEWNALFNREEVPDSQRGDGSATAAGDAGGDAGGAADNKDTSSQNIFQRFRRNISDERRQVTQGQAQGYNLAQERTARQTRVRRQGRDTVDDGPGNTESTPEPATQTLPVSSGGGSVAPVAVGVVAAAGLGAADGAGLGAAEGAGVGPSDGAVAPSEAPSAAPSAEPSPDSADVVRGDTETSESPSDDDATRESGPDGVGVVAVEDESRLGSATPPVPDSVVAESPSPASSVAGGGDATRESGPESPDGVGVVAVEDETTAGSAPSGGGDPVVLTSATDSGGSDDATVAGVVRGDTETSESPSDGDPDESVTESGSSLTAPSGGGDLRSAPSDGGDSVVSPATVATGSDKTTESVVSKPNSSSNSGTQHNKAKNASPESSTSSSEATTSATSATSASETTNATNPSDTTNANAVHYASGSNGSDGAAARGRPLVAMNETNAIVMVVAVVAGVGLGAAVF